MSGEERKDGALRGLHRSGQQPASPFLGVLGSDPTLESRVPLASVSLEVT